MMIRVMKLLSRSRMRMLTVGGHGSTVVNLNNRRWSSSSSSVPPLSSELLKKVFYERNSSATIDDAFVDKAIDFIMEAKHVFQDEPGKFDAFNMLLFEFRTDRIDLSVLKERMMEEFLRGHNSLIWKFNEFLPPGEIPLPLDDDGLPFKYEPTFIDDQ